MKPSRFRRYWPVLLLLPFLGMGMVRMLLIRPMAIISQGPISNGQMLSGSVAPGNTDTWSFYETAGTHALIFNADTPNAGTDFEPWIAIVNPNGTTLTGFTAAPTGVRVLAASSAQTGFYTLQVKNFQSNMFTGTVNVNLNLSNVPYSIAPGASGGVMYSSTNYHGTIGAHKMNMHIWNYAAKSGDTLHFTATSSAGLSAFLSGTAPNGVGIGGISGNPAAFTYLTSQTGNFVIFVGDANATAASANNYTLVATGSSVLPTDAKEDIGSACDMPQPTGCDTDGDGTTASTSTPAPSPTLVADLDSDC
jgi:hypothetical protein